MTFVQVDWTGVVPEWFTQMNLQQQYAFGTMTAVAVVFAIGFFALAATGRRRVAKVPLVDDKLRREITQDIHDKVLFERLCQKSLTPKQYRSLCRELNPLFPGLLPYGYKAKKKMKETDLKVRIANRLINGNNSPSGVTAFLRRVQDMLHSPAPPRAVVVDLSKK